MSKPEWQTITCPACKGRPGKQDDCAMCKGSGQVKIKKL
jgi:DnaJ-class molecular chaperone